MRIGLRIRLLIPLAVLLAGIAGATAWAAGTAARHAEERIAEQLARVARTLTEPPTFPLTPRVLEQMKGLSGAEFVFDDRFGRRLQTVDGSLELPPGLTGDETLGPPVVVAGAEFRGRKLLLAQPPNDGGTLVILYPETLRREAVRDAVRPSLVLGAAGGVFAIVLSTLAAGRLVTRIRGLHARTRGIAAGDFSPTPVPLPNDELADLARAVNDMAGKLGEYRDRLQEAERMRVIGQFAGGLAHQIRNAAMGARLAVDVFERESTPVDPEPLAVARNQLARIEQAVKQFLDLGRAGTGEKTETDLRAVITEVANLYSPTCRHSGTTLDIHLPDRPLLLRGDPGQLGHLGTNLVGNAIDAAGPGGTVTVTLAPLPTGCELTVADTGPGPPLEIAKTLFDPFVTGKPEGIGLGLAVAKRAVDAHGGTISWHRADGRTVFRVLLPRG